MRIKKQNELKMSLKGKMIIAVKHLWSNNLRRLEKNQQLNTPTQKKKSERKSGRFSGWETLSQHLMFSCPLNKAVHLQLFIC